MKGALIFLLVLLWTPSYPQIFFGPKIGVQVSRVSYENSDYKMAHKTQYKLGYSGGLVMNYKVDKTFSLHTELFYSRKGKIEKSKEYAVKNVAAYHYIDLPLLLRVSFPKKIKKQNVEFYFNAGPSFTYWFGGSGKLTSDELLEYTGSEKMKYKIKFKSGDEYGDVLYMSDPNKLQMELNFGAGTIFDLGVQKLMVDFRYGFGLGNTLMGGEDSSYYGLANYKDNFEAVNQVFSISFAYLYYLDIYQMLKKGKTTKKSSK